MTRESAHFFFSLLLLVCFVFGTRYCFKKHGEEAEQDHRNLGLDQTTWGAAVMVGIGSTVLSFMYFIITIIVIISSLPSANS